MYAHSLPLSLLVSGLNSDESIDARRQTLNAIAMPARCLPQTVAERNAEFVRQFTAKQREAHNDQVAKQAMALTAGQRTALRKQLDITEFLLPDYADTTKINIVSVLRKWKR